MLITGLSFFVLNYLGPNQSKLDVRPYTEHIIHLCVLWDPQCPSPPCSSQALLRHTLSDLPLAVQQGNTISQVKTGQRISHNICILYCKSHISLRFPPRSEATDKQSLCKSKRTSIVGAPFERQMWTVATYGTTSTAPTLGHAYFLYGFNHRVKGLRLGGPSLLFKLTCITVFLVLYAAES